MKLLVAVLLLSTFARAEVQHGLSVFGALKHDQHFKHFDYVNPRAPKGGALSNTGAPIRVFNGSPLLFDSLNGYILKGNGAQGLELLFDSLMVRGFDEPDSVYGLVAEGVKLQGAAATFHLRAAARFHDGSRLSAEDVVFSLKLLKEKGHPLITAQLKDLAEVVALSATKVRVKINPRVKNKIQRKHFFIFIAQLPIFSKSYYRTHDFTKTTLEAPMGSGPYKVKKFKVGRSITYQRQKNYWARALPVNRGRWNFNLVRFEYFRDRTSEFEAFKAGVYDLREEYTSKVWAKHYSFPAVVQGLVKRQILPDHTPSGAQGWFINMRRDKFKDVRVRQALNYAFDFEWTNRNQFYGLYQRTESFFENSPLKASGKPSAAELALLKPFAASLPQEVFGEVVRAQHSDGSGQDRNNLRRAARLLDEAGWKIVEGRRQKNGKVLKIVFMNDAPTFERVIQPFIKNLKILGIEASQRLVDAAQYQQRLRRFDFDLTTRRLSISSTPGIELRNFFTRRAASIAGGFNSSGVAHRAVDALVEKVINANTRAEQLTAAHALDRVLRALYVWVPQWFKNQHHIAYWKKFEQPRRKPLYARGVIDSWWARQSPPPAAAAAQGEK